MFGANVKGKKSEKSQQVKKRSLTLMLSHSSRAKAVSEHVSSCASATWLLRSRSETVNSVLDKKGQSLKASPW